MPPDDFFDEDWEEPRQTQETAVSRPARDAQPRPADGTERPPRNGGRMPRMPRVQRPRRPAGGEPGGPRGPRTTVRGSQLEWGRLAILAGGILVVVLVAWWALGRGGGGVSPTDRYFSDVRSVLTRSDAVGGQFQKLSLGLFSVRHGILSSACGAQGAYVEPPWDAIFVQRGSCSEPAAW